MGAREDARASAPEGMDKPIIAGQIADMPHDSHDHDHPHSLLPPEPALRVKALEHILLQKGLVDPAALDEIIDTYETRIGPRNGAHVVARAWSDPSFLQALRDDADAALDATGIRRAAGRAYGGG